MEYRGQIKNGVVVLDRRVKLKDGTKVAVRPIVRSTSATKRQAGGKSLLERLAPVVGRAKGLPKDFARNHDHYIHGQAKK